MDILGQYKKEHPEAFSDEQRVAASGEYGFWVHLVMRLGRGKIRDAKQAGYVLIAVAGCFFIAAGFFLSWGEDIYLPPRQEVFRDTPVEGLRPGA